MNPGGDTSEAATPTVACYRIRRQYLILGIACLAFFLAAGIGSVCAAYWNVDGSFGRPKLTALFFGVFWSCWVLLATWIIVAYYRERLFVTPQAITQHGCVGKNSINIPDVIRITWKRFPHGGSVIVRSRVSRIKIHFDNFSGNEQEQLIAYLRDLVSAESQEGWTRFAEARIQPASDWTPKKSRAVATICALLLFFLAGIVIYCWLAGLGVQWLIVGVLSAAGGVWYVWRIFNGQDQPSADKAA